MHHQKKDGLGCDVPDDLVEAVTRFEGRVEGRRALPLGLF